MTHPPCSPTREGDPLTAFAVLQAKIAKWARCLLCLPLLVLPLAAQNVSRLTLQQSTNLQGWQSVPVTPAMLDANGKILLPTDTAERFYRMQVETVSPLDGFSLIPGGSFQMGDQSNPLVGDSNELPVHSVQVSAFYMAKYEVTKELWDTVRAWGLTNGYTDLAVGGGKAVNHPVHTINWYDMVEWCNARSQKEGLTPCYTISGSTYKTGSSVPDCNWSASGYRLPSEAEWEKAARGGVSGKNFPWGTDTISHSQANYFASPDDSFDLSGAVVGYSWHPTYAVGGNPYSSPVGSFAANGYGLYDMAGNMWEMCWDWYGSYTAGSQTDPRGSESGSSRVARGGSWYWGADDSRVAYRDHFDPPDSNFHKGFRLARRSVP